MLLADCPPGGLAAGRLVCLRSLSVPLSPPLPPNPPRYVDAILPAAASSLTALAADLARVNDPALPPELRRAIHRQRMFAKKGGRKGAPALRGGKGGLVMKYSRRGGGSIKLK